MSSAASSAAQRRNVLDNLSRSRLSSIEIDLDDPIPTGFERFIDMKTGVVYYMKINRARSYPNLVVPNRYPRYVPAAQTEISSLSSPPYSDISSPFEAGETSSRPTGRDHAKTMVLMECSRCGKNAMMDTPQDNAKCSTCGARLTNFLS